MEVPCNSLGIYQELMWHQGLSTQEGGYARRTQRKAIATLIFEEKVGDSFSPRRTPGSGTKGHSVIMSGLLGVNLENRATETQGLGEGAGESLSLNKGMKEKRETKLEGDIFPTL